MSFGDALLIAFLVILGLIVVVCVGYAIYLAPIIGVVIFVSAFVVTTIAAVIYKVANR